MRVERLGVGGGEGIEEGGAVRRSRPPFQKIQPTWASLHHVEIWLKISNTNICILEPIPLESVIPYLLCFTGLTANCYR